MRAGHLRRHRRPGPQEAAPGRLRPGQPGPAAARLRGARLRPARLGRRRLRGHGASEAAQEHARTPWREEVWARLAGNIKFVPRLVRRRRRVRPPRRDARRAARHATASAGNAAFYLSIPPAAVPGRAQAAGSAPAWPTTTGPAAGAGSSWRSRSATTWPSAKRAQRRSSTTCSPPHGRVPHRPLPGQGDGPEHPGAALRQRPVRAGVELAVRRLGADHDGRGRRHRHPGRVLRHRRRRPRRAAEPPDAAARAGRDGGADQLRRRPRSAPRSSRCCGPSRCPSDIATGTVRGQYLQGWVAGERARRATSRRTDVPPDSTTETYVAVRLGIQNRRWAGRAVLHPDRQAACPAGSPRSRCCSRRRRTCRSTPPTSSCSGNNQLVIRVQPDEGVTLKFGSKVPGHHDGGPRHHDGLPVRRGVHRVQPRGVRAARPRRADRRPDAVPATPPRSRQSWRVVDPLEEAWAGTKPLHVPGRRVGSARGRRDAGPRRPDAWRRGVSETAMIALWDTTGNEVVKALAAERRNAGGVASGLALTLVVVVDEKRVREAETAAATARRGPPVPAADRGPQHGTRDAVRAESRLDAEIVVGGRLGPCEAVVMRMHGRLALHAESVVIPLLAPDVPVVTWWHDAPPDRIAHDPLGVVAERRITDVAPGRRPGRRPAAAGRRLRARRHRPGLDPDHAVALADRRRVRHRRAPGHRGDASIGAADRPDRRRCCAAGCGPGSASRRRGAAGGAGIAGGASCALRRRRRDLASTPRRRHGACCSRTGLPDRDPAAGPPPARRPARRGAAPPRRRPALRGGARRRRPAGPGSTSRPAGPGAHLARPGAAAGDAGPRVDAARRRAT